MNELAALQRGDIDLAHKRVHIRHNFDKKRRASTVKSEESETWMPLHPEAETALRDALDHLTDTAPNALVFHGPRGGIITSTLINDALTYGCKAAGLAYRVTAHGLCQLAQNRRRSHPRHPRSPPPPRPTHHRHLPAHLRRREDPRHQPSPFTALTSDSTHRPSTAPTPSQSADHVAPPS